MSIQRYKFQSYNLQHTDAIVTAQDGDMVKYTDHAAEVERLAAERDALHKQLADVLEISTEVPFDRCILHAGERLAGRAMRIKEIEARCSKLEAAGDDLQSVVIELRAVLEWQEPERMYQVFDPHYGRLAELINDWSAVR